MATDKATIESYNNYTTKWAEKLHSGKNKAHQYLEKPAMYKKLPCLRGKSVLCVGCGTGEECSYLAERGAKKVVGIDISANLIDYAKQSYPKLEFQVMDMENIQFPDESFDYIYSSLTLHYVEDWVKPLKEIRRVLKPKGIFLFSTHHPIKWGAEKSTGTGRKTFLMGYSKNKEDQSCIIYGDYLNTRKIKDIWFDEFEVSYYHKPISSVIKDIINSGFKIIDFIEPKPVDSARRNEKLFWEIHQKIPLFMIFELRK